MCAVVAQWQEVIPAGFLFHPSLSLTLSLSLSRSLSLSAQILEILDVSDSDWWMARKVGGGQPALIPSRLKFEMEMCDPSSAVRLCVLYGWHSGRRTGFLCFVVA